MVPWTAAAALLLCGLASSAPSAAGARADPPPTASEDAAHASAELRVGAAELAAVPAESRAVLAKVLGRLEDLRGELEELKAGKLALEARAESLSARVAELEENGCEDVREEEIKEQGDEQEEPEDCTRPMSDSSRRRVQAAPQACARVRDFQALSVAAMDACCPSNGGGHRRLQASCDLPAACPSAACAAVFVPYMQDCAAMLAATPGVPVADFQSFAASCAELQAGSQVTLPATQVLQFRVLVNTEGAAQAGGMFPGGGAGGGDEKPPLDPLQSLPPVPPPPPDATGAEDGTGVQQYHAFCTSVDVASCVPECNAEHHGYELLATIDGTDTKFSCNLAHGLYSWMGAASEGGYLGSDSAAFSTAIRSGAAGFYMFSQAAAEVSCVASLTIRADQHVKMSTTNLEAVWRHSSVAVANTLGVNSAMEVLARATLTISGIAVEGQLAVLGGELYVSNCDFDDTELHYTAPQDQTCCPDRANGWAGIAIDVQAGSANIRSSRFHGIGASAPFTIHHFHDFHHFCCFIYARAIH